MSLFDVLDRGECFLNRSAARYTRGAEIVGHCLMEWVALEGCSSTHFRTRSCT